MVLQVLADAWRMQNRIDAVALQPLRIADPGPFQDQR